MKQKIYRDHCACNIETGEVIVCLSGNNLKRLVKRTNRLYVKQGYSVGKWIFAHGADFRPLLEKKLEKMKGV
jgi:hypothetical protein